MFIVVFCLFYVDEFHSLLVSTNILHNVFIKHKWGFSCDMIFFRGNLDISLMMVVMMCLMTHKHPGKFKHSYEENLSHQTVVLSHFWVFSYLCFLI